MSSTRSPACPRATSSAPAPSWIPPVCARRIAEYYNINQQNVHAYVFGEHGDSSFVPWSTATISTIPVDQYAASLTNPDTIEPKLVHSEVESYIRKSGGKIIERKGATFYAVAVSVCHICQVHLLRCGHHHDGLHHDARRIRH